MDSYKELYTYLFNQISDAIYALENREPSLALGILRNAQLKTEEAYISRGDDAGDNLLRLK